jgi:hypothetical protein
MRALLFRALSTTGALLCLAAPVWAQGTLAANAPVPSQITSARTAFVSNAGTETYGSDVYYRLTKYDGGPDRLYNTFYNSLKTWQRFTLVGSPAGADVAIELRFANPIVDRENRYDFTYDPQVSATLVDPKTHITLWTLTEHIEPARTHDGDNANFDHAVQRLVGDLELLVTDPNSAAAAAARATLNAPPAGAANAYSKQLHMRNAIIGAGLGALAGGILGGRQRLPTCDPSNPCMGWAASAAERTIAFSLSGALLGGLAGWLVPAGP